MNKLELNNLELEELNLKTFTEQDALDYCLLNNTNHLNIFQLWLSNNELTDISGIRLFKNLKELYLYNNKLTDISVLKHLKYLNCISIGNNQITDISVIQYLKKLKYLNIDYSLLNSDQIKYIQCLKNLKELLCKERFKDMSVINKLNENIKIYE